MIARGYHWHLLCSSEIQKKGKEMFKISNDSTELKVAADFLPMHSSLIFGELNKQLNLQKACDSRPNQKITLKQKR
jgi:hypothetical protein